MSTYTPRELQEINDMKDRWEAYEHDKWKLLSFDEDKAKFGWLHQNLQYTKYVTITREQIKFFVGVDPDALDVYYA